VDAAREHHSYARLQARVAGALRKLLVHNDARREVAATGGVAVLIRASQEHSLDAMLLAGFTGALANLTEAYEFSVVVVADGGVEALLDITQAHGDKPRVLCRGTRALANMAATELGKARLSTARAIGTLIDASIGQPVLSEVQANVASALCSLSTSEPTRKLIINCGGMGALREAAQMHAGIAEIDRALRALDAPHDAKRSLPSTPVGDSLLPPPYSTFLPSGF